MCKFCEKIYPEDDFKDIVFGKGKYSNTNIEEFITIDEEGLYDINIVPGDPYEAGILCNIKFCPYCGKELKRNEQR